jgi:glycerol-3-phosphate acyltransferase PlsY
LAIFALGYPAALAVAGLAAAAIVVARHQENIQRLLAGTESRFGQRKATTGTGAPSAPSGSR